MRSVAIETLYGAAGASNDAARPAKPRTSLWARFSAAMIAARTAQAKALVARHMVQQDDDTLHSLGWTTAEISELRRRNS